MRRAMPGCDSNCKTVISRSRARNAACRLRFTSYWSCCSSRSISWFLSECWFIEWE